MLRFRLLAIALRQRILKKEPKLLWKSVNLIFLVPDVYAFH